MNRLAIVAALLAGLLTGWVMLDVVESITSSSQTTRASAQIEPAVPASPAEPAAPVVLPEREPPETPEQEGLYALIDATGQAVARCALDGFPEGAELPGDHVVLDGQVFFPVEPTELATSEDGASTFVPTSVFQFDGERSYSITVQAALPGSAPGPCAVMPVQVDGNGFEDVKGVARSTHDAAEDEPDDTDDAMHPAQVALDTPGLSDGARQWLQERLDAALELEKANAPVPVKGLMEYK